MSVEALRGRRMLKIDTCDQKYGFRSVDVWAKTWSGTSFFYLEELDELAVRDDEEKEEVGEGEENEHEKRKEAEANLDLPRIQGHQHDIEMDSMFFE